MGEAPQSGQRVTVDHAARHLGLTVDAVRKRVQRGTIKHDKDAAGRVRIILDSPDITSTLQDESPDTTGPADALIAAKDETIEELRSRVQRLEREVDTRNEEIRRRDHLLAAALERIPAIEAPQEHPEDAETVEEQPEGAEPTSYSVEVHESSGEATEAAEAAAEQQGRGQPRSATGGDQEDTERPQELSGWLAPRDKLPWWQYVLGLLLVVLASFLLSPILVVNWLPSGVFGLWAGFRRRNPRFWAQIIPFGLLVGLAIAPGDVVTTLGWDFARTAKADSAAHLAVYLAAYIAPTVIAGWLFYVSGVLIGNAWQRRRSRRLSGTILAYPEPTTNWTPRQQAILGFVGTVIAALISLMGTVLSVILASGS